MNKALDRRMVAPHVPKGDLAREALRRFLVVTEFRALRAKMVPLAEARVVAHAGAGTPGRISCGRI
jgi:hypothetical protein